MNLKINPPEKYKLLYEAAIYAIPFDLDNQGNSCDGFVFLFPDRILININDDQTAYKINDIEELKIIVNIGCGAVSIKQGETGSILFRFTNSHLERVSEFIKSVNLYIKDRIISPFDPREEKVCSECGKRYVRGTNFCPFCSKKTFLLVRLFNLAKPYHGYFLLSGILLLLSTFSQVLTPALSRIAIDKYFLPRNDKPAEILMIAGLLFLLYLGQIGFYIISRRIINKASNGFTTDLRNKVYKKIQSLSMADLSKRTTGDMMHRVNWDTRRISNFFTSTSADIIKQVVLFVTISIILFASDWRLALLVFLPIPIVVFAINRTFRFIKRRYDRQWRQSSRSSSILHDIIKGIKVVKSFGNEKYEIKKYDSASKKLADISAENERLWVILFPILGFFICIGEYFVLYFGSILVLGEKLSPGQLLQFINYTVMIYGPLRWMTFLPRHFAQAASSAAKIIEILDEPDEFKAVEGKTDLRLKGEVVFENVSFGYKSYETVLKNISFKINPGEMVGIVGRSGVGKSTLINLCMRLYDVDSGAIKIDSKNITEYSPLELRKNIGVVFQESFLFAGTIYDNIKYAKQDASPEEVITAAKFANAHEFIMKLPDCYNTIIGEDGHTLSGGERQRISIARAVLHNPSILILDEATSSLDTETEKDIQDALFHLIKGRTTITIAHRLSTLRHADRLIVLENGRLAEMGSHDELMRNKGVYYNLVMAQRVTSKLSK